MPTLHRFVLYIVKLKMKKIQVPQTSTLLSRPSETNLNYKALYEKERSESERLRKELDELRRSQDVSTVSMGGELRRGHFIRPALRGYDPTFKILVISELALCLPFREFPIP